MPRWFCILLAFVACVCGLNCTSPAIAQTATGSCEGGERGLIAAYAQSFQRERSLSRARGFRIEDPDEDASPFDMAATDSSDETANARYSKLRLRALKGILQAGGADTAIALFSEDGGRHCVYILAADGIRAFGATPPQAVPARTTIAGLLDSWRTGAGIVEGPTRGVRATMLTGAKPALRPKAASAEALAAISESLADNLFPQDTRSALAGFGRLVIVPYAGLAAVPYAALPIGTGDAMFVDRLAVSISPGPRYFNGRQPLTVASGEPRRCTENGPQAAAVVLGDPVVPSGNGVVFPALPGARREATDVARRFGVPAIIGKQAGKSAIVTPGRGPLVIHIAAHGVADSDAPLDSYLALSDGLWTARDIQRSCLIGTRLAILSACQSGLGGNHDGGIIGLGRAFILAGSANVAMSLWSVDDAGTEVLMRRFTKNVASLADRPDEALRSAMLETRRSHPQPFIWAAFTILGGS